MDPQNECIVWFNNMSFVKVVQGSLVMFLFVTNM